MATLQTGMPATERVARRAARRARADATIRALGWCLAVGGVAALVAIGADRFFALGWSWRAIVAGAFGAGALAGLLAGSLASWSLARAAGELDARLGLRDRLSSGLALAGGAASDGAFAALATRDAEHAAGEADVVRAFPVRFGRAWGVWPVLLAGAVAAGVFLPARAVGPAPPTPEEIAAREEAAATVAATIEQLEAEAQRSDEVQAATGEQLEALREIERELAAGSGDAGQALAESAATLEQAADAMEREAARDRGAGESLRDAMVEEDDTGLSPELAEALRSGDLASARDAARELLGDADRMSDAERRRLADGLEALADRLEREQEETERAADSGEPDSGEELNRLADAARESARRVREGEPATDRPEPPASEPAEPRPSGVPPQDRSGEQPSQPGQTGDRGQPEQREQEGRREQPGQPDDSSPGQASRPSSGQREEEQPGEPREGTAGDDGENPAREPAQGEPSGEPQERPDGEAPSRQDDQGEPGAERETGGEGQPREGGDGADESPSRDPGAEGQSPREGDGGQPQPGASDPDAETPQTGEQGTPDQPNGGQQGDAGDRERPAGEPGGERGSEGARREGEQPGRQPGGEPGAGEGQSPSGEQGQGRREGLDEALDGMARRQGEAGERAQRARELRERADEMLGGSRPDGEPRGGGAGDGDRDATTARPPTRFGDAATAPADFRPDPGAAAEGSERIVSEWFGEGGERPDGAASPGAARAVREAAGGARRAIEQQAVPRKYRDLVRGVFDRMERRVGGAPPEDAPLGRDASDG